MKKILAFGDSIIKGISLVDGRYHVNNNRFTNVIEDRLKITIENKGRMGSTVNDLDVVMERSAKLLQDHEFDTVFLEYGGNDSNFDWQAISEAPKDNHFCNTELDMFVEKYKQKIEEFKNMEKQVFLLSLPPIDPYKYYKWISQNRNAEAILEWLQGDVLHLLQRHEMYNIAVFRIAAATQVPLLDISTCFFNRMNYTQLLCEDGIHLNSDGHKMAAEAIINQIM